jgi:hypothetical protein
VKNGHNLKNSFRRVIGIDENDVDYESENDFQSRS